MVFVSWDVPISDGFYLWVRGFYQRKNASTLVATTDRQDCSGDVRRTI
jgi:hypothetical protein